MKKREISFLDLNRLHRSIADELKRAFSEVLEKDTYILGNAVQKFERKWADYVGTSYAIGTGTGLNALYLILEAYKILGKLAPGDKVLVPSNTYVATVLAILRAGLKPAFVEPDEHFNISVEEAARFSGDKRVKVLMPVHLYGLLSDMDKLKQLAGTNNWLMIEDAAQAHGAVFQNKKAGAWGHAAAFSFYPTKNLGALGDGGIITTSDKALAETVSVLRNYGQKEKYHAFYKGINSRLDTLQAAILSVKLPFLEKWNADRRKIARFYENHIQNPLIKKPVFRDDGSHVYHQYVIRVSNRDTFKKYLASHGITGIIHYPVPPHKQKALQEFHALRLPVAERMAQEVLSLPPDPLLSWEDLEYIVNIINAYRE